MDRGCRIRCSRSVFGDLSGVARHQPRRAFPPFDLRGFVLSAAIFLKAIGDVDQDAKRMATDREPHRGSDACRRTDAQSIPELAEPWAREFPCVAWIVVSAFAFEIIQREGGTEGRANRTRRSNPRQEAKPLKARP